MYKDLLYGVALLYPASHPAGIKSCHAGMLCNLGLDRGPVARSALTRSL